jgi:hypothetical protein
MPHLQVVKQRLVGSDGFQNLTDQPPRAFSQFRLVPVKQHALAL